MLHLPTAVGFHNPVLSSLKPIISVGLPTPYSTKSQSLLRHFMKKLTAHYEFFESLLRKAV